MAPSFRSVGLSTATAWKGGATLATILNDTTYGVRGLKLVQFQAYSSLNKGGCMQREEEGLIVISCDFCQRDWDGAEAMIEGHHGSILCLECLKRALQEKVTGDDKYNCTLCLRFNIPGSLAHWRNSEHSEAIACQECLYQAAGTFSKNPDVDWTWDRKK